MEDGCEHEEAKRELEGYLNERMRVCISDGRVVDGLFQCTDKHRNIVLANCEEFLNQDELEAFERAPGNQQKKNKVQPRTLSLAIIPGEHICSMLLATDINEHLSRDTTPPLSSHTGTPHLTPDCGPPPPLTPDCSPPSPLAPDRSPPPPLTPNCSPPPPLTPDRSPPLTPNRSPPLALTPDCSSPPSPLTPNCSPPPPLTPDCSPPPSLTPKCSPPPPLTPGIS